MNHLKLSSIKWVVTFILTYFILGMGYGITLGTIVLLSLFSFVTYYVGDVLILKRTNNVMATSLDFVFNLIATYSTLSWISYAGDRLTAVLLTSFALISYELFFHLYVADELNYNDQQLPKAAKYRYLT